MKLTTQSLRKFKSDNELRDIVRDSEDDIVTEVVQCVIEHRSSPEQVLYAIIEEIKSNADQIKRDGKVNVE